MLMNTVRQCDKAETTWWQSEIPQTIQEQTKFN